MLKTILACVTGCMVAVFVIVAMDTLGGRLFPPPPGVDLSDPAQVKTFVSNMSLAAKAWIVLGWGAAAAFGGWAGVWIAPSPWPPRVVAVLMAAGIAANAAMIPHPLWMPVAGVGLAVLAGWFLSRRPA